MALTTNGQLLPAQVLVFMCEGLHPKILDNTFVLLAE